MPSNITKPAAAPRTGHIAGLDGLRAIAVGLVLVYHLFPGLLRGGFIGVDVFFVISGFLITTLLLREKQKTGRIALGAFWQRRARRLLPAIALVVLSCGALATIVGGDALVGLGRQIIGAVTFSFNWLSVVFGASYFDQTSPELFRNFWSLAVEEQFYIVWPLLFVACMAIGARFFSRSDGRGGVAGRRVLGVASLVVTVFSVVLMSALYPGEGDATRVYFGTDTHAFGLALGSLLACLLLRAPIVTGGLARGAVTGVGAISVVALVVLAAVIDDYQSWTYPWGLLLASLASAGVISAVMLWPRLGDLLDAEPLRWVGVRSYGIYLWHWPLVVLAAEVLPGASVVPIVGILVLAITLLIAQVSYRWIEQPFRRYGFRVIARRARLGFVGASRSRSRTMLLSAYGLAASVLLGVGIVQDPGISSSARVISDGQDQLQTQHSTPPQPSPSAEPEPSEPEPSADAVDIDTIPDGARITAIGDSVMLASVAALQEHMPGIAVDAAVSRGFSHGISIAENLQSSGELRDYVVLGLATNGVVPEEALDRLSVLAEDHRIVLVTAYGDRPWIPPGNAAIKDFVADHPGISAIADWDSVAAHGNGLLAPDLIHPEPAGATVYANEVARALEQLHLIELGLKPHRPVDVPEGSETPEPEETDPFTDPREP